MPFVSTTHAGYAGQVVADGHCVRFVQQVAACPHTSLWVQGRPVWEIADTLAPGTAVATFDAAGRYANAADGTSHAAIFVEADEHGFWAFDQWRGRPVARRLIRARGGDGLPCDDADAYAVIEVA